MDKAPLELCASCLFGLEGPLGNELRHMGMEAVEPENGRVRFRTDLSGLARANIRSRFAERILLKLGEFPARSFDELFEGVRALPFEDWIPRNGAFPVEGWSVSSALHSVPDCQRIIKKAAASRLGARYAVEWLPETGEEYRVRFTILKDICCVYLDTSGRRAAQARLASGAQRRPPARDARRRARGHRRLPGPGRVRRPLLRQRHDSHRGRAGREGPRAGREPPLRRRKMGGYPRLRLAR